MSDTEIHVQVKYSELKDRGLNEKASNTHPQIERLLKEICLEKYQSKFPRERLCHFTKIYFSSLTDTYFISVDKGMGVPKG